jgi:hypothetical protein
MCSSAQMCSSANVGYGVIMTASQAVPPALPTTRAGSCCDHRMHAVHATRAYSAPHRSIG